ncbi:MAG: PIN domain-containing protein [Chloroflexota bacterium]
MHILIDTNTILDALLNRSPWAKDATTIWERCTDGLDTGYIPASILSDIYYITRRQTDRENALKYIELCFNSFKLCSVNANVIASALQLPHKDFEDNIFIACAILHSMDAIVTRNTSDFQHSPIDVYTPSDWLAQQSLNSSGKQ